MTDEADMLTFDRRALALIRADVARVADDELTLPTPCDGWNIADVLEHMNREHAAICGGGGGADVRARFEAIADRWRAFFDSAGDTVRVPKLSADLPAQSVLATHAADMLIHRWDLAAARGETLSTPADLLERAHSVADFVTAEGSPLVGPGGVYKPALAPVQGGDSFEALLRKYGRNPKWAPR